MINSMSAPCSVVISSHLGERFAAYPQLKDVLIMQSNGGVAPIGDSSRMAVRAILSGPAGGVSAAAYIGQLLEEPKVIAFDMGGTSTDISLIENGVSHITNEKFEAGWKIAAPMIDIHTLGAGGGSIARVDEGGILHVGRRAPGLNPARRATARVAYAPLSPTPAWYWATWTPAISWEAGPPSTLPPPSGPWRRMWASRSTSPMSSPLTACIRWFAPPSPRAYG